MNQRDSSGSNHVFIAHFSSTFQILGGLKGCGYLVYCESWLKPKELHNKAVGISYRIVQDPSNDDSQGKIASLQAQLNDALVAINKLKLASSSPSASTATPPPRTTSSTPQSAIASQDGSNDDDVLLLQYFACKLYMHVFVFSIIFLNILNIQA